MSFSWKSLLFCAVAIVIAMGSMAVADQKLLILKNGDKTIKVSVGSKSEDNVEELSYRVWELEQAVADLQYKLYNLPREREDRKERAEAKKSWSCQVNAMGLTFYGEGPNRGSAEKDAMEKCQQKEDPFFCKVQQCSSD